MRIKLIANALAGRYDRGHFLADAAHCLSRAGNHIDVEIAQAPGEGTAAAKRAVSEGYDLVVGCGGDGTLREIVCGLAGSEITLGIIPIGTGNVLALDLRIPRNPLEACRVILERNVRRIDIGRCGNNHFILAAGVGFDAEVITKTDLQLKAKVKNFAYIYAGLKHILGFKPKSYFLEADDFSAEVSALAIAICNSSRYGGYRLKPDISITDGLFDVCVMRGRPLLDALKISSCVLYRWGVPRRNLITFKTRYLKISSEEGGLVQNDGDVVGNLPADFEVIERAMPVIVPKA